MQGVNEEPNSVSVTHFPAGAVPPSLLVLPWILWQLLCAFVFIPVGVFGDAADQLFRCSGAFEPEVLG